MPEARLWRATGRRQGRRRVGKLQVTGFVRLNSTSNLSDDFSWHVRGGRHTDSLRCEGSAYHGRLQYNGRARWSKESWHVSYVSTSTAAVTSSLVGRWIGLKAIVQNMTVSDRPAVKLELWLNDNADRVTWTKVYETTDDGTWGGDSQVCGGSDASMPTTWGGPIAFFRWDLANDVDFKWASVSCSRSCVSPVALESFESPCGLSARATEWLCARSGRASDKG